MSAALRLARKVTVLLGIPAALSAQQPRAFDPVRADPPADTSAPAGMYAPTIPVGGTTMVSTLYTAAGTAPRGTVVLLHGFPGYEQNGDLAQAIRRAGWNVLMPRYRGAWGSGGEFAFAQVPTDIAAAVTFLRSPAAARFRGDPARVALIGHSMGAWGALLAAAADSSVRCVAGIGTSNIGNQMRAVAADSAIRAALGRALAAGLASRGGPIKAASPLAMQEGMTIEAADLLLHVPEMRQHAILLVGGTRDEAAPLALNHKPLAAALRARVGSRFTEVVLPADHSFSGTRLALADAVVRWLSSSCAP